MNFAFLQKVNNSIATKLRVTLINNCRKFYNIFSVLHNSMTKLCSTFLNMKINRVLKYTQMRARVEKVDVLGWNKSFTNVRMGILTAIFSVNVCVVLEGIYTCKNGNFGKKNLCLCLCLFRNQNYVYSVPDLNWPHLL